MEVGLPMRPSSPLWRVPLIGSSLARTSVTASSSLSSTANAEGSAGLPVASSTTSESRLARPAQVVRGQLVHTVEVRTVFMRAQTAGTPGGSRDVAFAVGAIGRGARATRVWHTGRHE
ncbi:hypothetical protein [Nannocystis sp.]|uniref:hypothetical protein n=1 Tax=Nannocystis sp. TaxID=1962667 RepID=UPI0025EA8E94|nr:hypothetical protein [Nannocystis sp.]